MNVAEEMQYANDLAVASFAAVSDVTDIVPIQGLVMQDASTAAVDFIAAAAGHIFWLKYISCHEVAAITGAPLIAGYDLTPTKLDLFSFNLGALGDYWIREIFVTRLDHVANGAGPGFYSIHWTGYDLTFT